VKEDYLKDVVGIVEANRFEYGRLYSEYGMDSLLKDNGSWVPSNSGYGETVGYINDFPICISLMIDVIKGKKVLFWHAMSQAVFYPDIENWLEEKLPGVPSVDAQNFHNVYKKLT
jgi:hypothetical protein